MNPNAFVGPDGKHYDLTALPSYIVRRGNRLYFHADGVAVFEVVALPGQLPQAIADWTVPKISTDRPY